MIRHTTRYQMLDHWRGLAALAVVFHHTPLYTFETGTPVSWGGPIIAAYQLGWWGVPAFFAISGYCVVAAADRSSGVGTYFKRRVRRIYPPYLFALCIVLALWIPLRSVWSTEPYPTPSPASLTIWGWLGNLTLTVVWMERFDESMVPLLGPAWTLCYEEGYYMVIGLLLAVFGRRWLLGGVVVATGGVCAAYLFGVRAQSTPADFYWFGFAAGAGAYFSVAQTSRRWRRLYALILIAAALLLVARTRTTSLFALHPSPVAGGAIGGIFAVILLVLHPLDSRLSGLQMLAPLQWCGQRCYAIYLMHWPICKTTAVLLHRLGFDEYAVLWPLVTLPLSILAGHLFHVMVERRFLNSRLDRPEVPHPPALPLYGLSRNNDPPLMSPDRPVSAWNA